MNRRLLCSWLLAGLWTITSFAAGADLPDANAGPSTWAGVEQIVAIGDVHGDMGQFVKALKAAEVINDEENWTAGKTHLVQTGDILDRGPESRKAMDLLRKLEQQAAEAGGMVHPLLGNHEVMVMSGDLRYVHPSEVKAFGDQVSFRQAFSREGDYGKWLRGHNTVIKINDVLFMHGGLPPHWGKLSLEQINEEVRGALLGLANEHGGALLGRDGPAWYRGWCNQDGKTVANQCDDLFRKFGVHHAVVGHTPQRGITAFGFGRVIAIDSGMTAHYGGPASALVIRKGQFFAVFPGKDPIPLIVNY
jgi:hypothetical protein